MTDSPQSQTAPPTRGEGFASLLETELLPTYETDLEAWWTDFIRAAKKSRLPLHRLVLRVALPSRLSRLWEPLVPPTEAEQELIQAVLDFVARPENPPEPAPSAAKARWQVLAEELDEDVYCDEEANFLRAVSEPAEHPHLGELEEAARALALDTDEALAGVAEICRWLRGQGDPVEERLVALNESGSPST